MIDWICSHFGNLRSLFSGTIVLICTGLNLLELVGRVLLLILLNAHLAIARAIKSARVLIAFN